MVEPTEQMDTAPIETIEFDEDVPAQPEPPETPYHTILEVWRAVLGPARQGGLREHPITPQWASKIVGSYEGVTFADTPKVNSRFFDLVDDLGDLLDMEIESDDQCLTRTEPDLDAVENAEHYRNLLLSWQSYFLRQEMQWDATDPHAAIEIAALSECHKMFFGQTGLTSHLDSIKFEFNEEHQATLQAGLEEVRDAVTAARQEAQSA